MSKYAVRRTRSDPAFGFTSYKDWQICNEKIWYQRPRAKKNFFIVIHRFSLVKAAMNAPRIGKIAQKLS
jgi:hypothetical protein